MKNDLVNEKDEFTAVEIVIPDECGDTLWDAVLQQEVKVCATNVAAKHAASLHNSMDAVVPSFTANSEDNNSVTRIPKPGNK